MGQRRCFGISLGLLLLGAFAGESDSETVITLHAHLISRSLYSYTMRVVLIATNQCARLICLCGYVVSMIPAAVIMRVHVHSLYANLALALRFTS